MGITDLKAFKTAERLEGAVVILAEISEALVKDHMPKLASALEAVAVDLAMVLKETGLDTILRLGQLQSMERACDGGFNVEGTLTGPTPLEDQIMGNEEDLARFDDLLEQGGTSREDWDSE